MKRFYSIFLRFLLVFTALQAYSQITIEDTLEITFSELMPKAKRINSDCFWWFDNSGINVIDSTLIWEWIVAPVAIIDIEEPTRFEIDILYSSPTIYYQQVYLLYLLDELAGLAYTVQRWGDTIIDSWSCEQVPGGGKALLYAYYFDYSSIGYFDANLTQIDTSNYIVDFNLLNIHVTLSQDDQLHHFSVHLNPDTINYSQLAEISVNAKNEKDELIDIPNETMLDFTLNDTNSVYGSYLTIDGTQTKALTLTYGDVNSGQLFFIADGDEPNGYKDIYINTNLSNDPSINGTGLVVVKDSILLSLEIPDSAEVWPTLRENQTNNMISDITATLIKNGHPFVNYDLTTTVNIIIPSGGHDHYNQPPVNLMGQLNDAQHTNTITLPTNDSGLVTIDYQSPKFCGMFEFVTHAIIYGDTIKARDTLRVYVPNLILLEEGINYELVGAPDNYDDTNDPCRPNPPTSLHYDNHYGTQNLINAIVNIADDYARLNEGIRLRINDMSLVYGGLFDTNNNWRIPHRSHREGHHVDIGFNGINQDDECEMQLNRIQLEWIIDNYSNARLIEGNHYHITVQ